MPFSSTTCHWHFRYPLWPMFFPFSRSKRGRGWMARRQQGGEMSFQNFSFGLRLQKNKFLLLGLGVGFLRRTTIQDRLF